MSSQLLGSNIPGITVTDRPRLGIWVLVSDR